MAEDRIAELEKLGMVWSHFSVAWEEGLAAARGWAAEAGHLLAPLDATHQGYRVGVVRTGQLPQLIGRRPLKDPSARSGSPLAGVSRGSCRTRKGSIVTAPRAGGGTIADAV
jgi:hypothetical protein